MWTLVGSAKGEGGGGGLAPTQVSRRSATTSAAVTVQNNLGMK